MVHLSLSPDWTGDISTASFLFFQADLYQKHVEVCDMLHLERKERLKAESSLNQVAPNTHTHQHTRFRILCAKTTYADFGRSRESGTNVAAAAGGVRAGCPQPRGSRPQAGGGYGCRQTPPCWN